MKKIMLLVSVLLASPMAFAAGRPLVSCKMEGAGFSPTKYGFAANAIAGEFMLKEKDEADAFMAPTRLSIQLFNYIKQADGTVKRTAAPGRPLERVGYTVLGDVVTFSYMNYDYNNTGDFQISTNGRQSQMTFSQDGDGMRDYQVAVKCEILSNASVDAPVINIADYQGEKLVELIYGMQNRRSTGFHEDAIPAAALAQVKANLVAMINANDFTSTSYNEIRWNKAEKCGDLKPYLTGYNTRVVYDYQANVIGYIFGEFTCENTVNTISYRYDSMTGERTERTEVKRPSINNVMLDKDFNIINKNSSRYKMYMDLNYAN